MKHVDTTRNGLYASGMEVHLTPEQESRLAELAQHQGVTVDTLLTDAALGLLQDDNAFRSAVHAGLAQANAGQFIEEEEMDRRFQEMVRR